jgi:hypothetical protein
MLAKFWRQMLLLGLKFWRQKFCTKNARVNVDEIDGRKVSLFAALVTAFAIDYQ